MQQKVYNVTELSQKIKQIMQDQIGSIWVEGEISNLSPSSSGHIYMTLKDENAQISLVAFKSFASTLKFKLENGQKIIVAGKITIYEQSSKYQIIANYIEPVGVGALQLAFEQLKAKLQEEGLFDLDRKKQIPKFPSKIGIVTSATGAAIKDILNVSKRRYQLCDIFIYPVKVQGNGSAQEISAGIDFFNKWDTQVDIILITRGGGSMEDLWAFNEEVLARAIAGSELPVVSAVGHEIDFTISDFAADLRVPTPSAAAEILFPDQKELSKRLYNFCDKISYRINKIISDLNSKINRFSSHYVFKESQGVIRVYIQKIDELELRLRHGIETVINNCNFNFSNSVNKLEALSPLKVLSRGYSIAIDKEDNVIRSVKDVKAGDEIHTKLCDGVIISVTQGQRP